MPVALRGTLAIGGALQLAGGILLLIDRSTASWMWPWPVSSLTGRAFGVWMAGFGIAIVQIAWEADWIRARPATAGAGVLGALQLIAVLRYFDVLSWNAPQTLFYVAVLACFVVLGIWGRRAAGNNTDDGVGHQEETA